MAQGVSSCHFIREWGTGTQLLNICPHRLPLECPSLSSPWSLTSYYPRVMLWGKGILSEAPCGSTFPYFLRSLSLLRSNTTKEPGTGAPSLRTHKSHRNPPATLTGPTNFLSFFPIQRAREGMNSHLEEALRIRYTEKEKVREMNDWHPRKQAAYGPYPISIVLVVSLAVELQGLHLQNEKQYMR